MIRTNWESRRPGVTLIEILVVLAIVGILMALTAAALQKTVEGQNNRTSESQVFKLQQALDGEYERVVSRCAQDAANGQIPSEVVGICDGNMARAKAVWTAYQLRLAFPETFAEANTTLFVKDAGGNIVYTIKTLPTFAGLPTTGTFAPEEESGVLLYLILTKRSISGGGAMASAAEDLTQASRRKVLLGGNEYETFADAFKRSVGFKRWETTRVAPYNTGNVLNEVQNPPYVDPTKSFATRADAVNRDPLDPQNLVLPWLAAMVGNPLATPPTGDQRKIIQPGLAFNGQNRMAMVYSLGKTKTDGTTGPLTPADDILGFRLRKQGERGFKQ